MYQFVNVPKLACLRRRLAIEASTTITAALIHHLWDKQTERSAIAIQKEMDKRGQAMTRHIYLFAMDHLLQARVEAVRAARALSPGSERNQKRQIARSLERLIRRHPPLQFTIASFHAAWTSGGSSPLSPADPSGLGSERNRKDSSTQGR
jgi:hypothetical protein